MKYDVTTPQDPATEMCLETLIPQSSFQLSVLKFSINVCICLVIFISMPLSRVNMLWLLNQMWNFFFIAVTNLAPGTTYIMEVVAYKKMYTSQSASITVQTEGKPLPQVSGLVCTEFVHALAHACTLNEYRWYTM